MNNHVLLLIFDLLKMVSLKKIIIILNLWIQTC